jgi:hypothetical protein
MRGWEETRYHTRAMSNDHSSILSVQHHRIQGALPGASQLGKSRVRAQQLIYTYRVLRQGNFSLSSNTNTLIAEQKW